MKSFTIITVLTIVLCVSIDFGYAQTTNCELQNFRCHNGECIANELLCDGKPHCEDQSDETETECSKPEILCPENSFRCKYGACINENATCDGIRDCVDNSDETLFRCNLHNRIARSAATSVSPQSVSRVCVAPPKPQNGYWKLHQTQCESVQDCDIAQGVELQPGSLLVYSCNQGYKLKGPANVSCNLEGRWQDIPICAEIRCRALNTLALNITCTYNNEEVPCNTPVLPGTSTTMVFCRKGYEFREPTTVPSTMSCEKNGQWKPRFPISCIPECGTLPADITPQVINGTRSNITELPWHASIYLDSSNALKEYLCGATIIADNLLITAAHCVYDEHNKRIIDVNRIYILAGNVFRDYDSPNHNIQIVQKARVKNIYTYCSYQKLIKTYIRDIAVLELIEPFILSNWLVPACVIPHSNEPGIYGKVAGFGRTAVSGSSTTLQAINVETLYLLQCSLSQTRTTRSLKADYMDKLCINYVNGSFACDGEDGGGIVIKTNGLWNLHGISSSIPDTILEGEKRHCDNNSYLLATSLTSHSFWIMDIMNLEPYFLENSLYGLCTNNALNNSNIFIDLDEHIQTTNNCGPEEFQCHNGECIASELLCNGKTHCEDQSDETEAACSKPGILCPENSFLCKYGACINEDATCNGIKDCIDNSDETLPECNLNNQTAMLMTSPLPSLAASKFCAAPPQPQNGYWKLHRTQCESGQDCDIAEGIELDLRSLLVYACNPGYKLNGSAYVFCSLSGRWLDIPVCTEIRCKALNTASIRADCSYNTEWVSCASKVLPGTVAQVFCRNSYQRDTNIYSLRSDSVVCNNNGQWNPEPTRCIPVCGILPANVVPQIVNGIRPNITDFPWHASIYRESRNILKNYICGATIIKENLLVTAAHCVYDEQNKQVIEPNHFHIVTGNIFRDYDSLFHNQQIVKKARVKNIYVNCNYLGLTGNYLWDIAVLELIEPFILSSLLVPACLDASTVNDLTILESSVYGKVAGFGRTATDDTSSILQALNVPYVPFHQCKSASQDAETEQFITIDKFCAGYINGTAVCDGDSGSGLVFKTKGLWYLRGIVSVSVGTKLHGGKAHCDNNKYTLYTRVSNHIAWIKDIIGKLEQNMIYPLCRNKS